MAKSLSDIRTLCYAIIKQPENCAAYPYVLIDAFINSAQADICFGTLKNPKTGAQISKVNLPFLNGTKIYTSVAPTTTTGTASAGANSLSVSSTTGFASSGALWVDGNIITYTGLTSTSFTGIPTNTNTTGSIQFAWQGGTYVYQLYSLPSDYGQMTRAFYDTTSTQYKMVGVDYRDVQSPQMNNMLYRFSPSSNQGGEKYYTIVDNTYFLPFLSMSGNAIRFLYQKMPTFLLNAYDALTIPDSYVISTVPYIATGEMLFNRGEPDAGLELWNLGFNKTEGMYRYYSASAKEAPFGQRMRTSRDGVINI